LKKVASAIKNAEKAEESGSDDEEEAEESTSKK
jgi:hypothetical protein